MIKIKMKIEKVRMMLLEWLRGKIPRSSSQRGILDAVIRRQVAEVVEEGNRLKHATIVFWGKILCIVA